MEHLGIESAVINIKDAYEGVVGEMMKRFGKFEGQAKVNLPPRLRMSVLYAVSQTVNGRVANTCIFLRTGWDIPQDTETVQEISALCRI